MELVLANAQEILVSQHLSPKQMILKKIFIIEVEKYIRHNEIEEFEE